MVYNINVFYREIVTLLRCKQNMSANTRKCFVLLPAIIMGSIVPASSSFEEYEQPILKADKDTKETRFEDLKAVPDEMSLWKESDLKKSKPEPGFELSEAEMKKLKLWPDGVIPYYIDVHSFSDKVFRDKIRRSLQTLNAITSLNFIELPSPPADDDTRWVFFVNRRGLLGCADHSIKNFTNKGVQQVILGYDCMATKGELAEAVLAIVGVPPQHNAPNRDKYITVHMKNIMPDKKYLYEKLKDDEWLFHDLVYDYNSIGHYDSYKYSINGRATIEATASRDISPKDFSHTDILKIKALYNYIAKKKQLQGSDCQKLFKPGSEFHLYRPKSDNIKPRKKPNKYLGLPDTENLYDSDHNEEINNEDSEEENEEVEENNEVKENNEVEENNESPEINQEEDESRNNDLFRHRTTTSASGPKGLKLNNQKTVDPLALLSDFSTDEEANMRKSLRGIKHKTAHLSSLI